MDYARIYRDFIARRKLLTPLVFERHHIEPRSRGGTDDPDNLIDLSPEDHFFAHLLLAKSYGGTLWVPVVMWLGGDRRNWSGRRSRLEYGWAVRASKRQNAGIGAHQYDHQRYKLIHKDGREFVGTQAEMAAKFGLTRPGVNQLIKRKTRSFCGWFFPEDRPNFIGRGSRKGVHHPMATKGICHFHHIDGREFIGTQYEMRLAHGLSKSAICNLIKGNISISRGWHIEGREPSKKGRAGAYKKAA